jgi:putative endopeptidase
MSHKLLKKIENLRNKTKKNRKSILKKIPTLTDKQKEIICKKNPSTFNSFEEKSDEIFKKNKIDITSTTFNLEKQIIKEIKQAVSPSNITPNNDFYSYINERWLKDIDIEVYQQYITQIDDFRLVQDKVYRELIEIINDYLKDPATKNTPKAKCIKNTYESFKKRNTLEQTRCLASVFVEYVDELRKSKTNVWDKLARYNANEIISSGAPFVWSLNPDDKNSKKYKCYLDPPQVTLLDLDIYYDYPDDNEEDKKYKTRYRNRYFQYLNRLFEIAFGENHSFNVKDIYDTEIELLNAMACNLIKKEDEDGYNLITKEEAIKDFGFDWEAFCKGLGFNEVPSDFVTSNVNYLLCGTKLLIEKWDSEQWRTYWIYIYISQQCRFAEYGWENYYEFYGKFLRGQERHVDDYIIPVFGMSFTFNTFLTNEYNIFIC